MEPITLDQIEEIVHVVSDDYISFNKKFISDNQLNNSLAELLVTDVYLYQQAQFNQKYLKLLTCDLVQLRSYNFEKSLGCLSQSPSYDFQYRVKDSTSMINKLQHYAYLSDVKSEGKKFLMKCLNDLFGCRIVCNLDTNLDKIEKWLQDHKRIQNGSQITYYYRDVQGYQGLHCYIKYYQRNLTLPWEIQFWDSKNEITNYQLHEKHEVNKEIN